MLILLDDIDIAINALEKDTCKIAECDVHF